MRRIDVVRCLYEELEPALHEANIWNLPRPSDDALEQSAAFGADRMSFEQWLRHVFMSRLRESVDGESPLPESSSVALRAHREWVMWGRATPEQERVIELLGSLDAVVSFHPRLSRLGFFETPRGGSSEAGRELQSELDAATTRSIGWQAELSFEAPGRPVAATLTGTLIDPKGQPLQTSEHPLVVAAQWTTCFAFAYYGYAEPGRLVPGRYRIELTLWDEPTGASELELRGA
jgi:uncharacterized protein YqcC (DUF446 family)